MLEVLDLFALAMIPAVLWLAYDVVTHYVPRFTRPISDWHGEDYLIMGVVVSFGFAAGANGVQWGAHFLAAKMGWDSIEQFTYIYGQTINIFTRWVPYIIAGMLHLAAAYVYGIKGIRRPSHYVTRSVLLTFAVFWLLMWMTKGEPA